MNEQIAAHLALVKKWHDDVLSPWEDQSWEALEASAIALQAEQAEPGFVMVRAEVVDFLNGSGSLDGVWFGEKPEGVKASFWWRNHLPAARPSDPPKAKQPDDLHIAYMAGFADGKKARPSEPSEAPVEPVGEREEMSPCACLKGALCSRSAVAACLAAARSTKGSK